MRPLLVLLILLVALTPRSAEARDPEMRLYFRIHGYFLYTHWGCRSKRYDAHLPKTQAEKDRVRQSLNCEEGVGHVALGFRQDGHEELVGWYPVAQEELPPTHPLAQMTQTQFYEAIGLGEPVPGKFLVGNDWAKAGVGDPQFATYFVPIPVTPKQFADAKEAVRQIQQNSAARFQMFFKVDENRRRLGDLRHVNCLLAAEWILQIAKIPFPAFPQTGSLAELMDRLADRAQLLSADHLGCLPAFFLAWFNQPQP